MRTNEMLYGLLLLSLWTCHCGARRPNKELIEGSILRVPGVNVPPILFPINKGRNGNATYGGIMELAMNWLATRNAIKFEFVEIDESVASKEGVLFFELYRMLANKEVDLVTIPLPMKSDQLSVVDYSYPVRYEGYGLMQKYPEEESRLTAILKPFSTTVWVCLIATIVVFIVTLTTFTIFHPHWIEREHKLSNWEHLSHHCGYVAATIAYQGYYVRYTAGRAFFILCGFWGLMMFVLTYAYTGNLTSSLVTPTYHPIANSLDDLVRMNMKITVISNTPLVTSLMNAVSGTTKLIGDFLRNHPDMITPGIDSATANVLREDNCAFIGQMDFIKIVIGKNYKLQHKCAFTTSKALSYMEYYAFSLTKDNPVRPFLSDSLMELMETGFPDHWVSLYVPKIDACLPKKRQFQVNVYALTLIDLSSAFLFLAIGIGLAMCVFVMEKFLYAILN